MSGRVTNAAATGIAAAMSSIAVERTCIAIGSVLLS